MSAERRLGAGTRGNEVATWQQRSTSEHNQHLAARRGGVFMAVEQYGVPPKKRMGRWNIRNAFAAHLVRAKASPYRTYRPQVGFRDLAAPVAGF